mmetsp:Transcript_63320/g.125171  ORF Transcript_63320/g.125171 Transcript_63320/m.125171 type:complete len:289 (-) Transcript_63320:93-959(-)
MSSYGVAFLATLLSSHGLVSSTAPHSFGHSCSRVRCIPMLHKADALYCLNVKLCVKPERREEFLACIANNQRGTLGDEPLAVTYLFGEDEAQPNTFHFFEQYMGFAGFEAHTKAPHFAVWEAFVTTDPFTAEPVVSFYAEDAPGSPGPATTANGWSPFCLQVALHVKPDRRDAFLAAMRADQEGALTNEPRCITYVFGEDANKPNTFHMFEQYVGREGFEEHTHSAPYAAWTSFKASEPFSAPPTVAFYTMIEFEQGDGTNEGAVATDGEVAENFGAPPDGFSWAGLY